MHCIWIVAILGLCLVPSVTLADSPTFVDKVTYVQYTDDIVALADIGAGRLDIHYGGLTPDLVDTQNEDIRIYESQSGSYSLLVNPADGESFNVFADRDARYALNYIVDRNLVVNELLGGRGVAMSLAYAPHEPDYVSLASAGIPQFAYDPALAERLITDSLIRAGASIHDGVWIHDDAPVTVRIFIRSDDLVRKSIGELLALGLSEIGLNVEREYGDLNKAFVVVYGSDPAKLRWNIYTEGWAGKGGFVRYDPVILAQMYAPWFSSMPGFNDPSYWNYEHQVLDELTGRIYSGKFADAKERNEIIWQAANLGVDESVRVFLAAGSVLYAASNDVSGIVNDFGAGVPSRFTPINAQSSSGDLRIGVRQIYQGAWNPVMGLGDAYSSRIWATLSDPAVFRHPYNGSPIPVRTTWDVQTAGSEPSIIVPQTAILWDATSQSWQNPDLGTLASSAVTFELGLSEWHHGEMMDIYDIMYAVYFVLEWGSERSIDDVTFDAEFASRAGQFLSTLRGVELVDNDTVRVYVDYWHFDESEIASWASVWAGMPWEIYAGMERAVSLGDASFSRSGAGVIGRTWLSLIVESDAQLVADNITAMRDSKHVPAPLAQLGAKPEYAFNRYDSALVWIADYKHAVISNGPFYLVGYSPESRTITTRSFDNASYPFEQGHWLYLTSMAPARITDVEIPRTHTVGDTMSIRVLTESATSLHYIVAATGKTPTVSDTINVTNGTAIISIPANVTLAIGAGTVNLTLYATSDDVLRPDIFSTSYIQVSDGVVFPPVALVVDDVTPTISVQNNGVLEFVIVIAVSLLVMIFTLWRRRSARLCASNK